MNETICAIATCVGNSSINIIRISGEDAIISVNKIFDKDLLNKKSHTITYGHIINNGEILDEVLVSIFRAPKTYTTENIVEINTHGGIICVNKILELLLSLGIKLATPGEFTKRAFINGRISLMEAESINDLINSKTELERKQAIKGLSKELNNLINEIKKDLTFLIGNIEVNIDYPEYEDAEVITKEHVKKVVDKVIDKVNELIDNSEKGLLIKNGINVCIVGKPNVGKSSLLNKLINEEKAIVTNIQGTTRDIVEGTIVIDGIKVNLFDTAGIRKTDDIVEKIGVEKSINEINKSDLILFVVNNDEFDLEDEEVLEYIKDKNIIVLVNKSDLGVKIDSKLDEYEKLCISTKNNENIDLLLNKISDKFKLNEYDSNNVYLSNVRQIALLKKCREIGNTINESINNNLPIDMIEIDVKQLWDTLNEIIGQTYQDELLDEIFSKFCLGK